MKRALAIVIVLLVAAVALPPLWYATFPADPLPVLPAAGRHVALPDGNGLNVLDSGDGVPVVLIHGLPGSAYDWRETAAALEDLGMRVIAYDRVGYGHSDPRTAGAYTPESNAAELIALLEALDLRNVTVVGWSYGGATAMVAAMEQPERVRRLVFVGTGGPDSDDAIPPEPSRIAKFFYSDPVLHWRTAIPPLGVALMQALSNRAFSDGPQPDWWLDGLRANMGRWDTLVTFREEMFGLTPNSMDGFNLTQIVVPSLLLHGDDDRLAPIGISRYLASRIPGATLVEFPKGSHMLPVTHADQLAQQIFRFSE
jgi:pimeloyl-ACP methyl ester carboxylesterase